MDRMFDAHYFRTTLQRDIEAVGGEPVVEVLLHNGHVHRVRAIIDAAEGLVTLDAFQVRGDLTHERPHFGRAGDSHETVRAIVSYESIVAVVLDSSTMHVKGRPGFGS